MYLNILCIVSFFDFSVLGIYNDLPVMGDEDFHPYHSTRKYMHSINISILSIQTYCNIILVSSIISP